MSPAHSFHDVFSAEELQAIRKLGDQLVTQRATVDGSQQHLRSSSVAWISDRLLKDRVYDVIATINESTYQFDLDSCLYKPLQYTLYAEGDEYGWHIDMRPADRQRKLSVTIQLSDPSEYDGGELELNAGGDIMRMPKRKGEVVAFPSWVLHRVAPVTRGVRRSLVAWATGPAFQ